MDDAEFIPAHHDDRKHRQHDRDAIRFIEPYRRGLDRQILAYAVHDDKQDQIDAAILFEAHGLLLFEDEFAFLVEEIYLLIRQIEVKFFIHLRSIMRVDL